MTKIMAIWQCEGFEDAWIPHGVHHHKHQYAHTALTLVPRPARGLRFYMHPTYGPCAVGDGGHPASSGTEFGAPQRADLSQKCFPEARTSDAISLTLSFVRR
jgi:hypothetical protein